MYWIDTPPIYLTVGRWRIANLLRWERLCLLLFLCMLIVPVVLRLTLHVYPFDPFLVGLYLFWAIRSYHLKKCPQEQMKAAVWRLAPTEFGLLLFIHWLFLSTIVAVNPINSLIYWLLILRGALIYIYIRKNLGTTFGINELWNTFTVLLVIECAVGILQFATNSRIGSLNDYFGDVEVYANSVFYTSLGPVMRVVGTFHNPNILANWVILLGPLTYVSLYFNAAKGMRIRYPLLILSCLTILLTFSRSGWLCFAFGALVTSAHVLKQNAQLAAYLVVHLMKAVIFIFMPLALIGIFILLRYTDFNLMAIIERFSDLSAGGTWRMGYVNLSWQLIQHYPLFGVGLGNFGEAIILNGNLINFPSSLVNSAILSTVHNLYMQFLAEAGIGAGFLWLAVTSGLLVKVWRLNNLTRRHFPKLHIVALWLNAAIFGYLFNTNFEALFFHEDVFMVFCILLGVLFATDSYCRRHSTLYQPAVKN